jgi:hypothetical protein
MAKIGSANLPISSEPNPKNQRAPLFVSDSRTGQVLECTLIVGGPYPLGLPAHFAFGNFAFLSTSLPLVSVKKVLRGRGTWYPVRGGNEFRLSLPGPRR